MGKRQASAGELMVAGTWALWPAARSASRSAAMVASRSLSEAGVAFDMENVGLVAQGDDVQVGVGHLEASDGQAARGTPNAAFWARPIARATFMRCAATSEGASVHAS